MRTSADSLAQRNHPLNKVLAERTSLELYELKRVIRNLVLSSPYMFRLILHAALTRTPALEISMRVIYATIFKGTKNGIEQIGEGYYAVSLSLEMMFTTSPPLWKWVESGKSSPLCLDLW